MKDRRRVALFALLALLGAVALLAAGCGGGSDESSGTETTIETTTTTETDTTADETTTDGDLNAFASEDCLNLASVGAKFAESAGASGSDPETTAKFFDELVAKAPDEIKDDLQVLSEAMAEVSAALKDANLTSGQAPDAAQLKKLQELGKKFSDPKYQQASANIEAWAKKNCSSG